jgi:mannose-6-phosphate isomerase class I
MGQEYNARPAYPPVGGTVDEGWRAVVAGLPPGPIVLAIDGPMIANWGIAVPALLEAWAVREEPVGSLSSAASFLPWEEVQERTSSSRLRDDPDFTKLATGRLADLTAEPVLPSDRSSSWVVYGPGAALSPHDVLWYADLPKRFAEEAVKDGAPNLGQPEGSGSTRRLFYIDWPLLDRHRDDLAGTVSRWLDLREPSHPTSLEGQALHQTMERLAREPFRTQPTFNTTPWGGHWGQTVLGHNPDEANTALGYELIAPESGVLVGDASRNVEVPFGLIVAEHPDAVLGSHVTATFGHSFPIRFDYLDTVGGGNLSVHCHPQAEYMRDVFGWPYTQHETYYVVVGHPDHKIFLGLRGNFDIDQLAADAHNAEHNGLPFDIEQYVQTFPAEPHRLYVVPAGTPHGSGQGNVVLEVSATPYLYSLRLYDWLRQDGDGNQRPTHVDHALHNLDLTRIGPAVADDLVQEPSVIAEGPGWSEEVIGALPGIFFEVRRVAIATGARFSDDTGDRFHILNVVEGPGVEVVTGAGAKQTLNQFETMLIPAATGPYQLTPTGDAPARIVKALVR